MDATVLEPARPKTRRRNDSIDPPPPQIRTTEEAIALRAYEFFVERGGEHGHDVEDWLRAERELRGTTTEANLLTRELNEKPGN